MLEFGGERLGVKGVRSEHNRLAIDLTVVHVVLDDEPVTSRVLGDAFQDRRRKLSEASEMFVVGGRELAFELDLRIDGLESRCG